MNDIPPQVKKNNAVISEWYSKYGKGIFRVTHTYPVRPDEPPRIIDFAEGKIVSFGSNPKYPSSYSLKFESLDPRSPQQIDLNDRTENLTFDENGVLTIKEWGIRKYILTPIKAEERWKWKFFDRRDNFLGYLDPKTFDVMDKNDRQLGNVQYGYRGSSDYSINMDCHFIRDFQGNKLDEGFINKEGEIIKTFGGITTVIGKVEPAPGFGNNFMSRIAGAALIIFQSYVDGFW